MDEVRKLIGVCPQHNVLWDDLTCFEHLQLFARIREVPEAQIEEMVDQCLVEVNLSIKRLVCLIMDYFGLSRLDSTPFLFSS